MIRWGIIPAAGQGRRLLPATLAVPKVLLPVGLRPMLDWTLEEAARSGLDRLAVVVSPHQPTVRRYLDALRSGDTSSPAAAGLAAVELHVVEQPTPAGIGDALVRCRPLTGDEPFAVLVPDNWFDGPPAGAAVAGAFAASGRHVVGLTGVAPEDAALYGNVGGVELEHLEGPSYRVLALQDKGRGTFRPPASGAGGEVLRGCARYALGPGFYELLEATGPPPAGEWDDVPAFQAAIARGELMGHRLEGRHFDVGQPAGLLAASAWLARGGGRYR